MIIDRKANELQITIAGLQDPAVSIIRAAPQRGDWRANVWTCPATARSLNYFRDKGKWTPVAQELLDGLDALTVVRAVAPKQTRLDYPHKMKPLEHQDKIFRRFRDMKGFGLYAEQGTGKSKIIIDVAAYNFMRETITGVLVFAWPNGVHKNWVVDDLERSPPQISEVSLHLPDFIQRRVCAWDTQKAGTKRWRKSELEPILKYEPGVLSWFTANSDGLVGKKLYNACVAFIEAHQGRILLCVDELSRFKKVSAKGYKLLMKLCKYARRLCQNAIRTGLTGTPVPKSPMDEYAMTNVFDETVFGFESFWSFRSRYAVMEPLWGKTDRRGRPIEIIAGYQNLEKMREALAPVTARVLKADCLDLPPKTYKRYFCNLSTKQQQLYDQLGDDLRATMGEREKCDACSGKGVKFEPAVDRNVACRECDGRGWLSVGEQSSMTAALAITRLMRWHQITMNIFTPDGGSAQRIEDGPYPRLTLMQDIADITYGKQIVWATYTPNLQELTEALGRVKGAVAITRQMSTAEREENLLRWRREKSIQSLVTTTRLMGYGRTLNECADMSFWSNDYSLERRLQGEDRNHRIGQKLPCTINDIEAEGTVDTKIIDTLRSNLDVANIVTGDKLKEWI